MGVSLGVLLLSGGPSMYRHPQGHIYIYIYIYIYHLSCEGHVVVNPPPCPRSLTASCFEPRLRLHPELLDGAGDADVTSAR